ncbi:MAG: type II CRISPR-associated endonuclease Cas1 [Lachnospiraceae bacterium]|nr:type II CRISPR-associated endonuclease Cas1 [Lachnospiraceae bacterium]
MSWRVVVISQRCKLDYSMNYMVVRGEETKRVLLDEMAVLILENNAISMTGYLLSELIERKIKVILCDGKRNPQAELISYYGAHNDSLKIKQQIEWNNDIKQLVWTYIVREKILNQAKLLQRFGKIQESNMLIGYTSEIKSGDISNREGHAAKVYFNALFGMSFTRSDEENYINSALNYGYALILSAFNREVVAGGYLTQLGLAHDNQYNHFNLSCDLMEPFRIIIDAEIINNEYKNFGTEEKHTLVNVLNKSYIVRGQEQTLLNAIKLYTKSVFDAINEENPELIKFVEI